MEIQRGAECIEEQGDLPPFPERRIADLRASADSGTFYPLSWRIAQLEGLLRFVDANESRMLEALRCDLGRCPADARMADISMVRAEIKLIKRNLRRWTKPRFVRTPIAAQPGRSWVQQEPYGLAAVFGAWNFPFQQILIPLAGAIAAGNAVVAKPSEIARNSAALIASELERYVDPSAVVVVSGGPETASRLLKTRFDTIFFTGSSRVGRMVMTAAAAHLTPVTLELGGKNPALVVEDAQLDVTARRIAWGRFMNAGQICVAPDYVLVPETLRPRLIESLRSAISRFYGEDPRLSPSYGRIVNQAHFNRLTGLLSQGTIVFGGQFDKQDRYIAPTVITGLPPDSDLLRDEIFGPILPVVGYDRLEDALTFIRCRPKPLVMYAFTGNRSLQKRLTREMHSGSIVINDVVINQIVPGLPFGGVGNSGMGAFHGRYTFDAFSHAKAVLRRPFWADLDLRYPPFTALKDRVMQWLISG